MSNFVVRHATPADVDEIIRLAKVMWDAMGYPDTEGPWEVDARRVLVERLGRGIEGFVVDHPSTPGALVASALATVSERIPAFWNPRGALGYLQWVSTDPVHRRQGMGRAVTEAAFAWMRSQGVTVAELHATNSGESLYRAMGCEDSRYPNLWFRIGADAS